MELYERLLKLIEFFEKNSQTRFAKKIGVSQATFWDYLNPIGQLKIRKVLLDKINLVYPQINRDWLFFGEGEMLKSDEPCKEAAPAKPEPVAQPVPLAVPQPQSPAPLRGFAACGLDGWSGTMTFAMAVPMPSPRPGMFAVTATGDSMIPAGIGNGHICFCDPHSEPVVGESVYVELSDKKSALKTFLGREVEGGEMYVVLQGWFDKVAGRPQKDFIIKELGCLVKVLAPVVYVQRRL